MNLSSDSPFPAGRLIAACLKLSWAITPCVAGTHYVLDLSGILAREKMQTWDPRWTSEYEEEFDNFEWQVDPGQGGQVGVWPDAGNPDLYSALRDYSQFIAAGPAAGTETRVRMKFEHREAGTWASCAHAGDSSTARAHYEVALQAGEFRIYKFWGPSPYSDYASVASVPYQAVPGKSYWIHLVESRVDNAVNGAATIAGELFDVELRSLAAISVTDTGDQAGQPVIVSSNKRGFGAYGPSDGDGPRILEWHVESALPLASYFSWTTVLFPPSPDSGDSMPGANPDADELQNGMEFYFGSDPFIGETNPMEIQLEGNQVVVRYPRRKNLSLANEALEISEDLSTWTVWTGSPVVVADLGDKQVWEAKFQPAAGRLLWVRLKVLP